MRRPWSWWEGQAAWQLQGRQGGREAAPKALAMAGGVRAVCQAEEAGGKAGRLLSRVPVTLPQDLGWYLETLWLRSVASVGGGQGATTTPPCHHHVERPPHRGQALLPAPPD